MKVQANTYDAEMGRTGGGTFNTFLRSGTNEIHGSAFGYLRRTEWLANNFFSNRAGQPIPDQPFKNYGGSIGGPVRGNNYLLDGVPITDSTNRAVIIPTIESVQEV